MTGGGALRILGAVAACLVAAACGGGGGGGSSSSTASTTTGATTTPTVTTPVLTNFTTITLDTGPAVLNTGSGAYIATNTPYVSVTLCAPGSTSNCQTIDHVLLDTGSVGLRVFASVLNSTVLNGLTSETDNNANPVGACYGYVDGYVFGSVRLADFSIGGETVSNMPLQLIADSGVFSSPPRACSSGGGTFLKTVQLFGANGVLGVGVTATDCGSACTGTGTSGTAIYFDCPSTGCVSVVGRAASTSAPFQQLPNPVAAMSVDNNGTIVSLPYGASGGQATMTGTLYFGIGTQTNNGLGSATVLTTSASGSTNGPGLISVSANNVNFPISYIDSGSNAFFFSDKTIAACTSKTYTGYYCPTAPAPQNPTIKGANGVTAQAPFTVSNAQTLFSTNYAVLPGIAGNPAVFSNLSGSSTSFDLGVAFFYGRNIYTAIEGRSAGGTTGPYFAF